VSYNIFICHKNNYLLTGKLWLYHYTFNKIISAVFVVNITPLPFKLPYIQIIELSNYLSEHTTGYQLVQPLIRANSPDTFFRLFCGGTGLFNEQRKKKWENPEQNRPRLSLQAVKMFMQVSCQWQRRWEEERRWPRWNSNRIANNNNITQPGQAKRPKRQKGQKAAGLTLVRIPLSSAPSRYRYRSFPHLIINCNSCRAKARSARWFPSESQDPEIPTR